MTKLRVMEQKYQALMRQHQQLRDAVFDIIDGNRNFRSPAAIIAETGIDQSRAEEIFKILREISKQQE